MEHLFGDIAIDGGVLGADVELILLEELGFVVVVFRLQLVGVVKEFSGAVDGGNGVETFNQPDASLRPGVVGAAVAGDQRTETVTHGGIPFLMAQLVADALDILLGRLWGKHLQ